MRTTRRVGRYTKYETTELIRMFGEGFTVYKICKNLNRSQKSIRNNLIKLGLTEGKITHRHNIPKVQNIENNDLITIIVNKFFYILFISILTFIMLVNPLFNILEMYIHGCIQVIQFIFFK